MGVCLKAAMNFCTFPVVKDEKEYDGQSKEA